MTMKFELGDEVRLLRDIHDDGTYPGAKRGELLVPRGLVGYIRDYGYFLQEQLIYSVHFLDSGRIVGCREHELQAANLPFVPSRYRVHDRASLKVAIRAGDQMLAEEGDTVSISRVVPTGERIDYHVRIADRIFRVPEPALEPLP